MSLAIKSIDPVSRPFFAGEVPAIEAGMDQFGVLLFHDQHFTDDTQLAFSRNFGKLETASGELNFGQKRRIESDHVNDISNLDLEAA
jgi:alpha-ketoglutarate-dependent 2,4-dichlorophenoxyacetate dioxygenase